MKARIQWAGEALFIGESGSGHAVVMDGPPESGGRNLGVRPMEMLLLGLGGCSNYDVVSILKKSRQAVESCEAFLEAERADEDPKVFTRIHLHFVVKGRGLKEAQRLLVQTAVGRDHRPVVNVGPPREVGEAASRLFHEDLHRRDVPRLEVGLDVDLPLALGHQAVAVVVAEAPRS